MDDSRNTNYTEKQIATNPNKKLNSIHTFQNIQVSTTGETNLTIINICTQLIHMLRNYYKYNKYTK